MLSTPFVVQPEDRPDPLQVVASDKIWVLASKEATHGYEIFLHEGKPGSGPRSHSHDWDESFFVLDGELKFSISGEEMEAKAGTFVHLPAGTLHEFKAGENGAKMISITGAGSKASTLFAELAAENAKDSPKQKNLIDIIARNGMHITSNENDVD
jgi:quercetin dioxygenase-like cupin family protein